MGRGNMSRALKHRYERRGPPCCSGFFAYGIGKTGQIKHRGVRLDNLSGGFFRHRIPRSRIRIVLNTQALPTVMTQNDITGTTSLLLELGALSCFSNKSSTACESRQTLTRFQRNTSRSERSSILLGPLQHHVKLSASSGSVLCPPSPYLSQLPRSPAARPLESVSYPRVPQ